MNDKDLIVPFGMHAEFICSVMPNLSRTGTPEVSDKDAHLSIWYAVLGASSRAFLRLSIEEKNSFIADTKVQMFDTLKTERLITTYHYIKYRNGIVDPTIKRLLDLGGDVYTIVAELLPRETVEDIHDYTAFVDFVHALPIWSQIADRERVKYLQTSIFDLFKLIYMELTDADMIIQVLGPHLRRNIFIVDMLCNIVATSYNEYHKYLVILKVSDRRYEIIGFAHTETPQGVQIRREFTLDDKLILHLCRLLN